eukprot:687646-Rhodomonas_salina.1
MSECSASCHHVTARASSCQIASCEGPSCQSASECIVFLRGHHLRTHHVSCMVMSESCQSA